MIETIALTTQALKEWAIALSALEQGKTIVLLRKGGIHEQGGRFRVAHDNVLLYPTYEHQQPDLLKDEYAGLVESVPSGWHPETVKISSYAEITDVLPVSDEATVKALLPYHIWNEKMVSDRLRWKPHQPLFILLLRTYLLSKPQTIPYRSEYGGCKSWIELLESISLEGMSPVLSENEYQQLSTQIKEEISFN